MRKRAARSLLATGFLAAALALTGAAATQASAAVSTPSVDAFPVYFAGGGEGSTRAAAEAAAESDANADKVAYEQEHGQTCTIFQTSKGSYQLGLNWWGAYVLHQATCQ